MKKEHLDIVWDSCTEFERSEITFTEFLEKLGRALESASTLEAKTIGEMTREVQVAMLSGSFHEMRDILGQVKRKVAFQARREDAIY